MVRYINTIEAQRTKTHTDNYFREKKSINIVNLYTI